jgi:hypothetical protein
MKTKTDFIVERNHDYTILIKDSKNNILVFRDITGNDLEFLDKLLEQESEEESISLSFSELEKILSRLVVGNINFYKFPKRIVKDIFDCVTEHILCNYIKKYNWLEACYGIQNGSFANMAEMEKVPMTKFMAMAEIHKAAVDSIKKEQ